MVCVPVCEQICPDSGLSICSQAVCILCLIGNQRNCLYSACPQQLTVPCIHPEVAVDCSLNLQ